MRIMCHIKFNSFMQSKSMDWFLYDRNLRHERVNYDITFLAIIRILQHISDTSTYKG